MLIHLGQLGEGFLPWIFINHQWLNLRGEKGPLENRQQQELVWKILVGQYQIGLGRG